MIKHRQKNTETRSPILILVLSFIITYLAVGILRYLPKALDQAPGFVQSHQSEIESRILEEIDPKKEHIKSITIDYLDARGDFVGDIGVTYCIYVKAYVNGNKDYDMEVELDFPKTGYGIFRFPKPNPYKDKDQDMSEWYTTVKVSDNSFWDWKRKAEEEEEEARIEASYSSSRAVEESSQEAKSAILTPKINAWLNQHQDSFKKALEDELYEKDPELKTILGGIKSIQLSSPQTIHSHLVSVDIVFENYPTDKASMECLLYPDTADSSFENPAASAHLSFTDQFDLVIDSDDVLSPLSKAFKKSKLFASNGQLRIRYDDRFSIPIP